MIPETKTDYLPWIKLPNPLKENKGEVSIGDVITIETEFHKPLSEKIKSFLIAEIKLPNGEKRTMGLNMTSYFTIAKEYGEDTNDWIGKEIVFGGFKQLSKGNGYLWQPVL